MRASLACGLVLVCQLHALAQSLSSEHALTTSDYSADLGRLVIALEGASAADAGTLANGVPLRWRVGHEGQPIVVDGTWLIHSLREAANAPDQWPQTRDRLKKRLTEMRVHAEMRRPEALSEAHQDVRLAANDILSRPEFRQERNPSWLERVQERIGEWLRSMLASLGADRLARRETAVVFSWIAAIAALAGLGIWLGRMLTRSSGAGSFGLTRNMPRRASSREWAIRAMAAVRGGDIREAVRCAYNCAIRRLEEEGTWRLDQSRTPREYLRMLKVDDTRRASVQELTEQFEQIWYGNRAVEEIDARRVSTNLERLGCLTPAERLT